MAKATDGDRLDGRTIRKDRNRAAVMDAIIELYREGNRSPRPEDGAARAGVSLRSVYRYFPEPSDLLTASLLQDFERARSEFECQTSGRGPLSARIDAFVDVRIRLHQAFAPACRVASFHADSNPVLAATLKTARSLVGDHIRTYFAPELRRMTPSSADAVVTALGAVFQLESMDEYLNSQGRSVEEVRELTREICARLLASKRARVAQPAVDLRETSVAGHAEDRRVDSYIRRLDR